MSLGRNKKVLAVIGLLLFGGLLRFYHIDYQSLWVDELYSIVPTAPEYSIGSIIDYCKSDQPPLFFLYLHFVFKFFGYDEQTGRIACAVIGLLAIPVMYLLGKEFGRTEVGIFAAFLTTINYFHIYYSQELRFYSMTFLLASLSYLFFIRAYKNLKIWDYIFYVFFTTALLYTHYYGMFVFGAQGVTFLFLLFFKKEKRFIVASVLAGLTICIAFLPWVPTIIEDLKISDATFWITRPKVYFIAEYFYAYTGKDALTTTILILLIFFFVKRMIKEKQSHSKDEWGMYIILVLWIALCYAVPYARSIMSTPILHSRYTIVLLPAWLLLFALGWDYLKNQKWKNAIVSLLAVSLMINLIFFRKYYTKITKEQFRESSQFVIDNNPEKYPIYSPLNWHFNFYFRKSPHKVKYLSERGAEEKCWLLQGHFGEEEKAAYMNLLKDDWEVMEKHSFLGAEAILLRHK